MKIWLAVHDRFGICPAITRGSTKREIQDYIKYASSDPQRYRVERFEVTPVVKRKRAKK